MNRTGPLSLPATSSQHSGTESDTGLLSLRLVKMSTEIGRRIKQRSRRYGGLLLFMASTELPCANASRTCGPLPSMLTTSLARRRCVRLFYLRVACVGNRGIGNLRFIGLVGLGAASRVSTFHLLDSLLKASTPYTKMPHMTSCSNQQRFKS